MPRALWSKLRLVAGELGDPDWGLRPRKVRLLNGCNLEVLPADAVGRSVYLFGMYEVAPTRLLLAFLGPGMLFVDVGANVGYYTVIAARCVRPGGRIISFEPVDTIRRSLERNVHINGISDIVVVRSSAIGSGEASVRFYLSADARNQGIGSTLPDPSRRVEGPRAPATTLDDLSDEFGNVDLLKIDIEGGEAAALQGARKLLGSRQAPAILFESFDLQSVKPLLSEFGYDFRRVGYAPGRGLSFDTPERDDPFSSYEAPNYFALKEGSQEAFGALEARARRLEVRWVRLLSRFW